MYAFLQILVFVIAAHLQKLMCQIYLNISALGSFSHKFSPKNVPNALFVLRQMFL